jgi:hypothetical protein
VTRLDELDSNDDYIYNKYWVCCRLTERKNGKVYYRLKKSNNAPKDEGEWVAEQDIKFYNLITS